MEGLCVGAAGTGSREQSKPNCKCDIWRVCCLLYFGINLAVNCLPLFTVVAASHRLQTSSEDQLVIS